MLQRDILGEEGAEQFLPHCQCFWSKTFLTSLRPKTHLIGEFEGEIRCKWPSPFPSLSPGAGLLADRGHSVTVPCLVREECAGHPCWEPGR